MPPARPQKPDRLTRMVNIRFRRGGPVTQLRAVAKREGLRTSELVRRIIEQTLALPFRECVDETAAGKGVQVCLRLRESEFAKVKAAAEEHEQSETAWIRAAVLRYLRKK